MAKKGAIIGSGLGGLSAAIRSAHSGFKVDVFEENSNAGGKANQFLVDGFRFDLGPSLLTMPFVIQNLFDDVDEKLEDYLTLRKLDVICKYYYSDGTIINVYPDPEKTATEIAKKTYDKKLSVTKYLKYCKKIYDLTSELFLFKDFSDPKTFLNFKALKTLLQINKIDPFRSMHQANSSFFHDPKTIQLFDRYATYNGSNPYKAPATLNIIQHVEIGLGGFVPEGGIYSISKALHNLAIKKGVNIHFNSKVEKIISEKNSVNGIRVNGNDLEYDFVVSNADVNKTYKELLEDKKLKSAVKYSKLTPSTSALVFYWGMKVDDSDLEIHNILFSENYKKEFSQLFEEKRCPDDPTIYIYISSKYNNEDAPEGYENWYVMINAPYIEEQNWEEEIAFAKKNILDKIKSILGIDLSNKIVTEKIVSPVDIERLTGSDKGSLYGISSNSRNAAFLRQANKSKELNHLYFCGGSAHPGGGIPLVLLSGKIAAESIIKTEKLLADN
ncbi:MAG: phytoene desaturase family protein [Melioribacteraceae bacterium]|nr:phytoene desaturase family protein [Melioribacteraceae bacterium]